MIIFIEQSNYILNYLYILVEKYQRKLLLKIIGTEYVIKKQLQE